MIKNPDRDHLMIKTLDRNHQMIKTADCDHQMIKTLDCCHKMNKTPYATGKYLQAVLNTPSLWPLVLSQEDFLCFFKSDQVVSLVAVIVVFLFGVIVKLSFLSE